MKANEAPEKLYLINDESGVILSYDPLTKLKCDDRYDYVDEEVFPIEGGCEVEYTRTDAFMEKAIKYIANHFLAPGMDNEINDFVNYMKGK